MSTYFVALVLVLYMVKEAECGECCKPHLSLTLSDQPEKWCPNYCCFHALNLYDCCDDILFRAPEDSREDICWAFFTSNVWAPIVGAVVTILLIVGCCVCCCKCCCGTRRSQPVIVQSPQPSMVVMSQQSTTVNQAAASPYNAGYNQVPSNPYNAGYDQPTQPPKYNY